MMATIVTISGSPAAVSRSTTVLTFAGQVLQKAGHSTHPIIIRDLNAEDLLHGRYDSPAMQQHTALIASADGIILSTPVYKAAYTGVLKIFLDLLPPNAFAGKVVLPCATGAAPGHMLIIDYALKPVLAALGAEYLLSGVYLTDNLITKLADQHYELNDTAVEQMHTALAHMLDVLQQISSV